MRLKELCQLNGVSGDEKEVYDFLYNEYKNRKSLFLDIIESMIYAKTPVISWHTSLNTPIARNLPTAYTAAAIIADIVSDGSTFTNCFKGPKSSNLEFGYELMKAAIKSATTFNNTKINTSFKYIPSKSKDTDTIFLITSIFRKISLLPRALIVCKLTICMDHKA